MARVFGAFDERLERPAAVKILRAETRALPGMRQRFQQEALIAARLLHPHIVAVLDFGEDHASSYLVMERLPGTTLRDEIIARGPLSPQRVLLVMAETLDALAAAHARGVLHRDIKPSNILLQQDGHTKITDFGIAKSFDIRTDPAPPADDMTMTGVVLGTPGYLVSRAERRLSRDRPVRPVRGRCGHGRGIDGTTPRSRTCPGGAASSLAARRGASRHGHGPTGPLHVGERDVAVAADRGRRVRSRATASRMHNARSRPPPRHPVGPPPACPAPPSSPRRTHGARHGTGAPGLAGAASWSLRRPRGGPRRHALRRCCGVAPSRQGRPRPRQSTTCGPRR